MTVDDPSARIAVLRQHPNTLRRAALGTYELHIPKWTRIDRESVDNRADLSEVRRIRCGQLRSSRTKMCVYAPRRVWSHYPPFLALVGPGDTYVAYRLFFSNYQ